ncbi:MAG: tail fiber domain-containing protein [Microbacteriaceae bacterium]|nr:tail fiber domain-containing protein [Microbacteriaceae bacterium]NBS60820.1 tail fiber domain-containing protein [Microbacteriaceae bacterium]
MPTDSGTAIVSGGFITFTSPYSPTRFQGAGNSVTLNSSSDIRLKKNIKDEYLGLDFIMKLTPKTFEFTGDTKNQDLLHHGFIAQDIEILIPDEDALVYIYSGEAGVDTRGFNTVELIGPLVKAIQQQQLVIQSLQEQIKDLNTK